MFTCKRRPRQIIDFRINKTAITRFTYYSDLDFALVGYVDRFGCLSGCFVLQLVLIPINEHILNNTGGTGSVWVFIYFLISLYLALKMYFKL